MSSESDSSSDSQETTLRCSNRKCKVSEAENLYICLRCFPHPIVCLRDRCRKRPHRDVKPKDLPDHEWLPYNHVIECEKMVPDAIWPDITTRQRVEDEENEFFYVDETKNLSTGMRFSTIYEEEQLRVRIVSVIGSSGTGKSTIMRGFCAEASKPLPCDKNLQSTTKGVKSYKGRSGSMIWDTEGQIGKDAGPAIEIALPRLVYAFSDVIVFVFNNPQQTDYHITHINQYATTGATGSANFARRPHLIVVLNKIGRDSVPKDIKAATKKWEKTCKQEELVKLKSNYASINVVHLPSVDRESKSSIYLFSKQQSILYDLIDGNLGRQDGSRSSQFQMMQCALQILNSSKDTNYNAPLDFFEMSRGKTAVPSTTSKFIEAYFHQVYACTKASIDPVTNVVVAAHQAWSLAIEHLNSRAFDIYCTTWMRLINRLPPFAEDSTYLDQDVKAQMEIAEEKINALAPCAAHQVFPGVGIVFCCQVAELHDDGHKSTKTWVDGTGGKPLTKPCHWGQKTNNSLPMPYVPQKSRLSLVRSVSKQISELNGPLTHEFYYQLHQQKLDEAKEQAKLFPKPHTTCFGCLTLFPSHIRSCGHNFCAPCLIESADKCLICDDSRQWSYRSIPQYAGIRILSLPGGGARSAISLGTLKVLQHLVYDIPVCSLFDYVIATSMGSLIAVSLISMRKNIDKTLDLLEEVGNRGFKEVKLSLIPVVGRLYRRFTGRKYGDTALKSVLAEQLEANPTFGCAPPMAITVAQGNELALLSSYVLPEELGWPKHIISLDIIESVRSAIAGGGLFRPYVLSTGKGGGTLEDGGKLLNDPICEGLRQVSQLFPDHTVDFAASMETGHPRSDSLQFVGKEYPTNLSEQPDEDWRKLKDGLVANLPDASYRVDPPLHESCGLESYHLMRELKLRTELYFKTLLDHTLHPDALRLGSDSYMQLVELSHRSVATMFTLGTLLMKVQTIQEDGKHSYKVTIEGLIRPRNFITTSFLEALGDSPFDFSIHSNKKHKELTSSAKLLSFEKIKDLVSDSFNYRFSLSATVSKMRFWFSIRCTIGSRAGLPKEPNQISGSPWLMSHHSCRAIPGRRVGDEADFKCAPTLSFSCPILGHLKESESSSEFESFSDKIDPDSSELNLELGTSSLGNGSTGEVDSDSFHSFKMSFESESDTMAEGDHEDEEISWANQKTQSASIQKK